MVDKKTKREVNTKLAKRTILDDKFAPVISNLLSNGFSLADVGLLIGFSGEHPDRWLKRLGEDSGAIQEAIQAGLNAANAKLVATAFDTAMGKWITEEEINYEMKKCRDDEGLRQPYWRWKKVRKKEKKRYIEPNTQLLWRLLMSRMPEYFNETKNISIEKRSVELKGEVESEIQSFAGNLLRLVEDEEKPKKVKSKEIKETEND